MNKKELRRRFKIRGATIKLLAEVAAEQEKEITKKDNLIKKLQKNIDSFTR